MVVSELANMYSRPLSLFLSSPFLLSFWEGSWELWRGSFPPPPPLDETLIELWACLAGQVDVPVGAGEVR